jgi:hypothetical protein
LRKESTGEILEYMYKKLLPRIGNKDAVDLLCEK